MKPVSYFLSLMSVFGLAASVLSGCVDDIKEPGGSLVVSPTEFNNVKGTGETLTINVESDLYWSVYAQDSDGKTVSWIEFDKTAGKLPRHTSLFCLYNCFSHVIAPRMVNECRKR